jgi:hypothetical protein
MTKHPTSPSSAAAPQGDGAPDFDDLITLRRSDLVTAIAAEMVDFYSGPYGPGAVRQTEARYIVHEGIDRALREAVPAKYTS